MESALAAWKNGGGSSEREKQLVEQIFALAKANPNLIDARPNSGDTPLHIAALTGNLEMALAP